MITFLVPPGIGDFSAMYAKLCNLDVEFSVKASYETPHRLLPFLKLLPMVKEPAYAAHGSQHSLMNTLPPQTELNELADGSYFLSINRWLEEGNRVEDWVPGRTTYHYEMNIPEQDKIDASVWLQHDGARVGIYTSAYGNSRHWGFWNWEGWRDFLLDVVPTFPNQTEFCFIGAEYDLAISEVLCNWFQARGFSTQYLVGALEIGGTIEVIKQMDYLFSFPSGIGFLADVVNTPSLMWFPESMNKMRYTFVDPKNMDEQRTLHYFFKEPREAAREWNASLGPQQFWSQLQQRRKNAKSICK